MEGSPQERSRTEEDPNDPKLFRSWSWRSSCKLVGLVLSIALVFGFQVFPGRRFSSQPQTLGSDNESSNQPIVKRGSLRGSTTSIASLKSAGAEESQSAANVDAGSSFLETAFVELDLHANAAVQTGPSEKPTAAQVDSDSELFLPDESSQSTNTLDRRLFEEEVDSMKQGLDVGLFTVGCSANYDRGEFRPGGALAWMIGDYQLLKWRDDPVQAPLLEKYTKWRDRTKYEHIYVLKKPKTCESEWVVADAAVPGKLIVESASPVQHKGKGKGSGGSGSDVEQLDLANYKLPLLVKRSKQEGDEPTSTDASVSTTAESEPRSLVYLYVKALSSAESSKGAQQLEFVRGENGERWILSPQPVPGTETTRFLSLLPRSTQTLFEKQGWDRADPSELMKNLQVRVIGHATPTPGAKPPPAAPRGENQNPSEERGKDSVEPAAKQAGQASGKDATPQGASAPAVTGNAKTPEQSETDVGTTNSFLEQEVTAAAPAAPPAKKTTLPLATDSLPEEFGLADRVVGVHVREANDAHVELFEDVDRKSVFIGAMGGLEGEHSGLLQETLLAENMNWAFGDYEEMQEAWRDLAIVATHTGNHFVHNLFAPLKPVVQLHTHLSRNAGVDGFYVKQEARKELGGVVLLHVADQGGLLNFFFRPLATDTHEEVSLSLQRIRDTEHPDEDYYHLIKREGAKETVGTRKIHAAVEFYAEIKKFRFELTNVGPLPKAPAAASFVQQTQQPGEAVPAAENDVPTSTSPAVAAATPADAPAESASAKQAEYQEAALESREVSAEARELIDKQGPQVVAAALCSVSVLYYIAAGSWATMNNAVFQYMHNGHSLDFITRAVSLIYPQIAEPISTIAPFLGLL
ncbi:unnamed protein product [Amoebophrya sp. A120]|nr:unnamed protein product [Amoebophrya sp. A120]|eukprot:GSA120T00002358001.1